jgi:hypothetical protein
MKKIEWEEREEFLIDRNTVLIKENTELLRCNIGLKQQIFILEKQFESCKCKDLSLLLIEKDKQLEMSQKMLEAQAVICERVGDDNARLFNKLKASNDLSEERRVMLVRCNKTKTWCCGCRTPMGYLIGGIKHDVDCDYIRLTSN